MSEIERAALADLEEQIGLNVSSLDIGGLSMDDAWVLRGWLTDAINNAGGHVTGGGMGCGGFDVDFEKGGQRFMVNVKPIRPHTPEN